MIEVFETMARIAIMYWGWIFGALLAIVVGFALLEFAWSHWQERELTRALEQNADRRHDYRRTPTEPDPLTGDEFDD